MFSFLSGKSLEQCSLCKPRVFPFHSYRSCFCFLFFDTTLYVHFISGLIRPPLVSRTREHSESQLKPKRECISYYNWMSWGHSVPKMLKKKIKMLKIKSVNVQTISSHLLVLLSSVSSSFTSFHWWLRASLGLHPHSPENLAERDFLFSIVPANFPELSYQACLS